MIKTWKDFSTTKPSENGVHTDEEATVKIRQAQTTADAADDEISIEPAILDPTKMPKRGPPLIHGFPKWWAQFEVALVSRNESNRTRKLPKDMGLAPTHEEAVQGFFQPFYYRSGGILKVRGGEDIKI